MHLLSIGLLGEFVITGSVCLGTDDEGRANNCIINRHGYRLGLVRNQVHFKPHAHVLSIIVPMTGALSSVVS